LVRTSKPVNVLLFLVVLLGSFCETSLAANGGSAYSRFGIGDLRFFAGGRSAGMGGTSLALMGSGWLNRLNPAGLSSLSSTRLSGTFLYEGFKTTDGNQSSFLSTGSFGGAMVAFPISPQDGIALSAGFNPYSSVNYKIQIEQPFGGGTSKQNYFGEGGLSTALVGLSYTPTDSLHLGVSLNYLFGQIRSGATVGFGSRDFSDVTYHRKTRADGFGATFGLIYNGLGRLVGSDRAGDFSVGAVFSTGTSLNATQENINSSPIGDDTLTSREGKIQIPVSGGVGIAWLLKEKVLLGADFLYQHWGDYQSFGVHPTEIRNSGRFSLGLEIQPSHGAGLSYWQRVAYRFGIYYLSSYYQVASTPINEVAFTAGLGLPISYDTSMDLAFEYGRRGTTDHQLLRDNILRFSITLNAGERWFVPSEED
jgi:hypothetical protein